MSLTSHLLKQGDGGVCHTNPNLWNICATLRLEPAFSCWTAQLFILN